ncbi:hypothetical protein ACFO0M_19935 [Micromonospora mangrovi]|uniref:WD40 repeat domain-containing protein n=2 Tax=Micromonospora TaxID=1873 RepID=A0AAU8H7V3_9ACTN
MSDDELARALRETFASRVAVPRPLTVDPAGVALRRARRTGRRRALAGLALAGIATVAVTTGMAQLGDRPGRQGVPTVVLGDPPERSASPRPTASPSGRPASGPLRVEVDLIVDATLETTGGEQRPLPGVDPVDRALRISDHGGWLVTSAATAAGRTLWWVPPGDGAPQVVLAAADAVALSPDGRQVAWRDGGEIATAGVISGQLIALVRTPAAADAVPVGFAGDAVLVRRAGQAGYSVWRPSAGPLPTRAERGVLSTYGTLPDGRVVGQVSAGTPRRPCVALLDPTRQLAPVRTGCGPDLATDGHGGVSADGRWLLANGSGKQGALLVDLNQLGADTRARAAGPAVTGAVTWTKGGAALYVDDKGGLVRVRVDQVVAGHPAIAAPLAGGTPGRRPVLVTDVTS